MLSGVVAVKINVVIMINKIKNYVYFKVINIYFLIILGIFSLYFVMHANTIFHIYQYLNYYLYCCYLCITYSEVDKIFARMIYNEDLKKCNRHLKNH